MYVFDTAMLLYIFKPTIDLNGGGRQGYIVTHYVSTSYTRVFGKYFTTFRKACSNLRSI